MSWLSTILSALGALLVAFLIWLIQNKIFAPRIRWSKEIAFDIDPSLPSGVNEYAKIRNKGLRSIINVESVCIFRFLIKESNESESSRKPDPHSESDKHLVCEIRTVRVPIPKLKPGATRTITFKTNGVEEDQIQRFPQTLRNSFNRKPPLSLNSVMTSVPGCSIRMFISATDVVSRTRKVFVNKTDYVSDDIQRGAFKPDSLDFVPDESS